MAEPPHTKYMVGIRREPSHEMEPPHVAEPSDGTASSYGRALRRYSLLIWQSPQTVQPPNMAYSLLIWQAQATGRAGREGAEGAEGEGR